MKQCPHELLFVHHCICPGSLNLFAVHLSSLSLLLHRILSFPGCNLAYVTMLHSTICPCLKPCRCFRLPSYHVPNVIQSQMAWTRGFHSFYVNVTSSFIYTYILIGDFTLLLPICFSLLKSVESYSLWSSKGVPSNSNVCCSFFFLCAAV